LAKSGVNRCVPVPRAGFRVTKLRASANQPLTSPPLPGHSNQGGARSQRSVSWRITLIRQALTPSHIAFHLNCMVSQRLSLRTSLALWFYLSDSRETPTLTPRSVATTASVLGGVKEPPDHLQRLYLYRIFALSTPIRESRRADSNRLPNLITSDPSGVAGGCRDLQIPHFKGVSLLGVAPRCTVLRSRWFQSGVRRTGEPTYIIKALSSLCQPSGSVQLPRAFRPFSP
jgi:hypothetical protein